MEPYKIIHSRLKYSKKRNELVLDCNDLKIDTTFIMQFEEFDVVGHGTTVRFSDSFLYDNDMVYHQSNEVSGVNKFLTLRIIPQRKK